MFVEIEVEVEGAFTAAPGRAFVLVRTLGGDAFRIGEDATLAGRPLNRFLEIPRKIDEHGVQRLDVFALWLRESDDLPHFRAGQRCALRADAG